MVSALRSENGGGERMKKSIFSELKTGFISPNGDFYESGYMEHLYVADEIYQSIYGVACVSDPEEEIIKDGWLSIHFLGFLDNGFLFKFKGHLTSEQIRAIKPIIEDNWDRVIKSNRLELEMEFYGVCDGMI